MELGASLGPYRIDRELGEGGMRKMFAATGPDLAAAKRGVDETLADAPEVHHDDMRGDLRVDRKILAAPADRAGFSN